MNITSKLSHQLQVRIVVRVSKVVTGVAVCLVLSGCGQSAQQPPFGQFPPINGGQFPGQQGQFPPVQQGQLPPMQFPPTPGKLDPGQLNPGQFGPVAQVPGGYVQPGIPGWNPLAAGTTGAAVPGAPGAIAPGAVAPGAVAPGAIAPGAIGANGQPVFQPAAPTAPGTTGVPTAPGSTGVPTAPGSTLAGTTTNASPTLPRFTNDQLAGVERNLASIKGTQFEANLTAYVAAPNYTAYQKYQALQQLAGQVAGALQTSSAQDIANLKNYIGQFDPDQGARVNQVIADVKALDETAIKTALRATHAKITAEMQKQLEAAQAVAATTPAAAGTQPAGTTVAGAQPPAAGVPSFNFQGAPAPQYAPGGPVQMLYVRTR